MRRRMSGLGGFGQDDDESSDSSDSPGSPWEDDASDPRVATNWGVQTATPEPEGAIIKTPTVTTVAPVVITAAAPAKTGLLASLTGSKMPWVIGGLALVAVAAATLSKKG